MERKRARLLLNLPMRYTAAEVDASFRVAVRSAHPDVGGDPADLRLLITARDVARKTAGATESRRGEPRVHAEPTVVIGTRTRWQKLATNLQQLFGKRPSRNLQ